MTSTKRDYSVGDLKKKNRSELLDLLQRQNAILSNSQLLKRLPDNGSRIKGLKEQIEEALIYVSKQDHLVSIFERLQIVGNVKTHDELPDAEPDISFKHTNATGNSENLNAYSRRNESSTKPPSSSTNNQRKHFKPYKNAKVPVKDPFFTQGDAKKTWIETAVTPPPARFTQIELLNLNESIELYQRNKQQLQQHVQQDASKALQSTRMKPRITLDTSEATFKKYRDVPTHFEGGLDSDDDSDDDLVDFDSEDLSDFDPE